MSQPLFSESMAYSNRFSDAIKLVVILQESKARHDLQRHSRQSKAYKRGLKEQQ